jgi:hypothetical protein
LRIEARQEINRSAVRRGSPAGLEKAENIWQSTINLKTTSLT